VPQETVPAMEDPRAIPLRLLHALKSGAVALLLVPVSFPGSWETPTHSPNLNSAVAMRQAPTRSMG
jgi:hypothetical protein